MNFFVYPVQKNIFFGISNWSCALPSLFIDSEVPAELIRIQVWQVDLTENGYEMHTSLYIVL